MDVQTPTTLTSLTLSAPILNPLTIATISTVPQAPTPSITSSSTLLIVQRYMDQRMNEVIKIIKEQVKEQVKVQVSKILSKIEKMVNEQLEAEVLTRSSKSSKTSYVVAADLSEMELKKILIAKMEGNKDVVTLKRRRDDDADKDEEPFAESDRGSKRQREGNEPESTSAPKEKATRITGKSTQGSKSQ
nr:hypothetical protein [Tanacetum cinerariifolium]